MSAKVQTIDEHCGMPEGSFKASIASQEAHSLHRVVRTRRNDYTVTVEGWPYVLPPMGLREALQLANKHLRPARNKPGAHSVTITRGES